MLSSTPYTQDWDCQNLEPLTASPLMHPIYPSSQEDSMPSQLEPLPELSKSAIQTLPIKKMPTDATGTPKVFFIGVAGGTASGKTSVCTRIINELASEHVSLVSQDSFYKVLSDDVDTANYNFDHPDAIDYDLFDQCLEELSKGLSVDVPVYSFLTHKRSKDSICRIPASSVVMVEGLHVLYCSSIRKRLHMRIFVDTDADLRLLRRIRRDISERGRTVDSILTRYQVHVKPCFEEFISPTKIHADIIIPHWPNEVAVDLIVQHIRSKLGNKDLTRLYPQLKCIPGTSQIRQIHTIIRDKSTLRSDFVFNCDRLTRILAEHSLTCVPCYKKDVITPTGKIFSGLAEDISVMLCGVSLVRNGESMEIPLLSICNSIPIGKILLRPTGAVDADGYQIQNVVYCKLPSDISKRYVLLLDPILSCGSNVMAAVNILLQKGALERNIIYLNLVCCPYGVKRIFSKYPELQMITSYVDEGLDEKGYLNPGLGNFGHRYYGTDEGYEVSHF